MAFHHVAVATRDLEATHRFYTEAMGFRLAKVVAGPNPEVKGRDTGWSRHVFYDTGSGEMFAVWDLHDAALAEFDPAIATGLGLPVWTNHIAFRAASPAVLAVCRDRWLAHGIDVLEVDHGWCTSIYATDPNGIMVEWCVSTRELTAADADEAARLLRAERPDLEQPKQSKMYRAAASARAS